MQQFLHVSNIKFVWGGITEINIKSYDQFQNFLQCLKMWVGLLICLICIRISYDQHYEWCTHRDGCDHYHLYHKNVYKFAEYILENILVFKLHSENQW